MQYPGNCCRKLEVNTKFRVAQEFEILERFEANHRKFAKIRFLNFWKSYSIMLSYSIPWLLQPPLLHWTDEGSCMLLKRWKTIVHFG